MVGDLWYKCNSGSVVILVDLILYVLFVVKLVNLKVIYYYNLVVDLSGYYIKFFGLISS